MKKFARFLLITILVTAIAGTAGYFVLKSQMTDTYTSTARLYVVTGPTSSGSLHDSSGGLNKDFEEMILSDMVLYAAERYAGTTEDLSEYIEVDTVAGSNFIDITCYNPDQLTAKRYADAVAHCAIIKLQEVMPVDSVSIYQDGTSSGKGEKRNLIKYSLYIAGAGAAVCVVIGFFSMLFGLAFKNKEEDDEAEYYRNFGNDKTPVAPKKASKKDDEDVEIKEAPKKKKSERIEEKPTKKAKESKEVAVETVKEEPKEEVRQETKEEAAARYRAEFEARARQQAAEKAKAQQQAANDMLKVQLEAMENAKSNGGVTSPEESAAKEAEEEAAAAAKKKAEEEAAAAAKKAEEEAAKKAEQERLEEEARRAENLRLAEEARKAEAARLAAEAEAKRKAEEEAAAAAKKKAEEEAAAAAKKKAEEEAAAAAKKKAEEEAAAAAKKKAEEEAAAAKKRAEEEAAAAKKAKAYKILERIPK